jgi:hypothetical protein
VTWLVGLVSFVIGVLLGWCLPALRSIGFNSTVDIGNVLNAIAVLVVGLLINYLYTHRASSKKADTDLLLDVIRDCKTALGSVLTAGRACDSKKKLTLEQQRELTSAERELSNAVHSVELALCCCSIKLDTLNFQKLKDARAELKDSLTDSPFPGPYDNASLARMQSASKSFRDELTRVAFSVNHR